MTERRWLKPCPAVDAETGKRCTLLEHGSEIGHSASGRPFKNPLAAGAAPRREIDRYAVQQREAPETVASSTRDLVVKHAHERHAQKKRAERAAAIASAFA